MDVNHLFKDLNAAQKQAALHTNGPMVVFAGAGSGKTKIITTRIAYLIALGTRPWEILAVTFTNKAAGEMRQRVESLTEDASRSLITTFHAACSRWLREFAHILGYDSNFTIYDDNDSTTLIKQILKEINPKGEIASLTPSIKSFIHNAKNNCITPDALDQAPLKLKEKQPLGADHVYREYQKRLAACNAMDFNDLLLNMLLLLRHHKDVRETLQRRYRFVLVDEFQDTNRAQFELVKTIVANHHNLFVVGDDDQSIYSWRGAIPTNITSFDTVFPETKTVLLEQNYRCSSNIVDAASDLISHNKVRAAKKLFSEKPAGDPIDFRLETDGEMEAWWVIKQIEQEKSRFKFDEVAIFYRTNSQSRAFEEMLTRENIPYTIYGSVEFYARMEIKDLLAYVRLAVNEADDISLRRIINIPTRGIGAKAVEGLETTGRELNLALYPTLKHLCSPGSGRSMGKLAVFFELIENIKKLIAEASPIEVLPKILEMTSYPDYLRKKFPDQHLDKMENIYELITSLEEFLKSHPTATLTEWLQTITLMRSDNDEQATTGVSLMTLHMAKGLEFPRVYIGGLEDGILPHQNSLNDNALVEEERRLLYVGITRAKQKLSLTAANRRRLYDKVTFNLPSRFLEEIPEKYLNISSDEFSSGMGQKRSFSSFGSESFGGSEPHYNYDEKEFWNDGDELLTPGARVYHPTYGKGIVKDTETHFGKTKLIIDFFDFGERKISSNHLQLLKERF
jgi:DNA helicase-2/ATP-dependent DNA helicase PcrA